MRIAPYARFDNMPGFLRSGHKLCPQFKCSQTSHELDTDFVFFFQGSRHTKQKNVLELKQYTKIAQ